MKPNDISSLFDQLFDLGADWFDCLKSPHEKFLNVISKSEPVKKSFKIWVSALIFGFIIQSWVYQSNDIALQNFWFHFRMMFFHAMALIFMGIAIFFSLKLFKIDVDYDNVMSSYILHSAAVLPFTFLLLSPSIFLQISVMGSVKKESLVFGESVNKFLLDVNNYDNLYIDLASSIGLILFMLINIFQISSSLNSVAEKNNLNKTKVLQAGSFSFIIFFALGIIISFLQFINIYNVL